MDLERSSLSREELYESAEYLKKELVNKADSVLFSDDGASVNPHSWNEMDKLIDKGYDRLIKEYDFISQVPGISKKILASPLMTYTHISGIYIPFTGEANVNTNYPDYVVAFTAAHEKAHQRGIASEDDANFIAFLSLLYSNDDYLEYTALMNMYDYFLDAMYEYDEEMYVYTVENTDERILKEMYSYYKFFKKYSNSKASEIAQTVNDTYIKAMGDEEGVKSYGRVVELYYAYLRKNVGLPE